LKNKIKTQKSDFETQNKNINDLSHKIDDLVNENDQMKQLFNNFNKQNQKLKEDIVTLKSTIDWYKKEKDNIIHLSQVLLRLSKMGGDNNNNITQLYQEAISVSEIMSKLKEEKLIIKNKIDSLNEQYSSKGNNYEQVKLIEKETNAMNKLLKEFDSKIKDKEKRFEDIKNEMNKTINNDVYSVYADYGKNYNLNKQPIRNNSYINNLKTNNNNNVDGNLTEYDFEDPKKQNNSYLHFDYSQNNKNNNHENTVLNNGKNINTNNNNTKAKIK
jgi:uncharacterized coiled-coil DUF342 family protein